MNARLTLLVALLALSGCTDTPVEPPAEQPAAPDAYDDGRTFTLDRCEGVEVAQDWVGAHGPNGPRTPPASWQDDLSEYHFSWSLELLECERLGWGPLERGPVTVGLEVHNAYRAPDACTADLEDSTFLRYVHAVYLDDPDLVDYATSWAMPVVPAAFSWQDTALDGVLAGLQPEDGAPSTVDLRRPGAYDGEAAHISAAFFWFHGDQVHRLTLYRQTQATLGDVAVLDMAPPSIMGDHAAPTPASASWLTNLHWSGELVTFQDHACSARVVA